MKQRRTILVMLCLMLVTGVTAKLKLPAVITDHMVIQLSLIHI